MRQQIRLFLIDLRSFRAVVDRATADVRRVYLVMAFELRHNHAKRRMNNG
jgi:hypothetical protein